MTNVINFNVFEQQPLAVTGTSAGGAFTIPAAQRAPDCMLANYGSAGAQVIFGSGNQTAVPTANAAGTNQIYIPAGAILVINKNNFTNFAAITDAGTTTLIFHAGSGN